MAQSLGVEDNPCYSRKIGVVIVSDDHQILSTGYNGPPAGTPHTDTEEYLRDFFWPQLTDNEKSTFITNGLNTASKFGHEYAGCKVCPRRLVEAGSGQRSSLCSCQHAERNAISRATSSLKDSTIFVWGCSPCIDCTGAIINSRIKTVHTVSGNLYHPEALWLLKKANINYIEHDPAKFEDGV